MAAQAALTVNTRGTANGAATATVVYNPVMASQSTPDGRLMSRWQEQSAAYAVGYSDLVVISKPAIGSIPTQTVSVRMSLPTLEVTAPATGTGIQPAPSVAYFQDLKLEGKFPTRGTAAERHEALARFLSIAGHAFLLAMVKTNEQVT